MGFFHSLKERGLIHLSNLYFRETLDRGKERGKIVSTGEDKGADGGFTLVQSG